jgi:hypothetical protein
MISGCMHGKSRIAKLALNFRFRRFVKLIASTTSKSGMVQNMDWTRLLDWTVTFFGKFNHIYLRRCSQFITGVKSRTAKEILLKGAPHGPYGTPYVHFVRWPEKLQFIINGNKLDFLND